MTSQRLFEQLVAVRRRMRRLLAIEGLSRLVVSALTVCAAAILIDWWVRVPPFVRAAATLCGALLMVRWLWRHVFAPLRSPIPLRDIASIIDEAFPQTRDALATALEHAEQTASAADREGELWRRTMSEAQHAADDVPWRRVVRPDAPLRAAATAIFVGLAATLVIYAWFDRAEIGLRRYLLPFGDTRWPNRVAIQAISGSGTVAVGEPITAQLRLTRGESPAQRCFVVWKEGDGDERRELMNRADDGTYSQTLAAARGDLVYWFEAGDDSTRERPARVRVAARPTLVRAAARVRPPDYAAVLGEREASLSEGPVQALNGSRVTLDIRMSKPVSRDSAGRAAVAAVILRPDAARGAAVGRMSSNRAFDSGAPLAPPVSGSTWGDDPRWNDQASAEPVDSVASAANAHERLPFEPADNTDMHWTASLRLERSLDLNLIVTDIDGLEPRPTPRLRLQAIADTPPVVSITKPTAVLDVAPNGAVTVMVRANDDVDLTHIMLRAGVSNGRELLAHDMWSGSARSAAATRPADAEWPDAENPDDAATSDAARVAVSYRWQLGNLNLAVGTVIEYHAEASDGFELDGKSRPPVSSAVMRLRIVSPTELADRVRDDVAALVRRLKAILVDQLAIHGETVQARNVREEELSDAVDSLRSRQRRVNAALHEASQRFLQLATRVRENGGDETAAVGIEATAGDLRAISEGPAQSAATLLAADLGELRSADATALDDAGDKQAQVAAGLKRIIAALEGAGDFDGIVRKGTELLDRQEELARATSTTTRELAGREVESLQPLELARLAELAARQEALERELQELTKKADAVARQASSTDRTTAEMLSRVREGLDRESVAQHMRDAGKEIKGNRGNSAAESQQSAANGLRTTLALLNERAERKLAELSKQLLDAQERLEKIIKVQQELNERTGVIVSESDAASRLPGLATRQDTLKRTTAQAAALVAAALRDAPAAQPSAADLTAQAADGMAQVVEHLTAARGAEALERQGYSLESLKDALAALRFAQEKADDELGKLALDSVRGMLEKLHEQETAIAARTQPLALRAGKQGRGSRADGIALQKLAVEQDARISDLKSARDKLKGAAVYDFACEDVHLALVESAGHMRVRSASAADLAVRRAVAILAQLIDALQDDPPTDGKFAQERASDGGGKSGKGATRERPVPALAELRMLRTMQAQLNASVKSLGEAAEPQIEDVASLGRRQQAIRDLAARLLRDAEEEEP